LENGCITWEDREPTPDPEEAFKEAVTRLEGKMEIIIKQQTQMMEMITKLQEDKSKAGGSKAAKKPAKAKDNKD
jgi:hypothetical protein